MSAVPQVPPGPGAQAPDPAASQAASGPRSGRPRGLAVLFLVAAVIVLLGFVYGFRQHPRMAVAALALLAVLAAFALSLHWLAHRRVAVVLMAAILLVPAAALLGPNLALPQAPQAFAFRILLVFIVYVGITWLLLYRLPLPFAAKDLAVWLALWFGYLLVSVGWAGDKAAGLRYLVVLVTMMLLVAATAAAGTSRRRLQIAGLLFVLAFASIIGVTVLEYTIGFRLPTSRLTTVITSQTYAVTSVFRNQNDLATYLAICWPFMLCAYFFTRRVGWLGLATLAILFSAAAFVRTGSRSSLLAVGVECLAALVLFEGLTGRLARGRLATRRGKIVGAVVALVLVAGAGYLLFNNSQSPMLRQFRLATLTGQAKTAKGSGAIREDLTRRGLEIAGTTMLGAGPGQAEVIIGSGAEALGISNLHDWWLETYADGGLPGFTLHLLFFLFLLFALWPIAKADPDPFVRYMASGCALALIGFVVGALGPSSVVSFAPLWALYGLCLAVVSWARLAAARRAAGDAPHGRADSGAAGDLEGRAAAAAAGEPAA
jgi:teichuronic acid biosynthesis protein TuaE